MKNYNINIKRIIFASLLVMSMSFSMQSQVTIGTLKPPLKGVLLDLKQEVVEDDGKNSTSGMILPRVSLNSIDNLIPIFSGSSSNYAKYTGLMVYNVNETAPMEKGIHVWDGTQWNHIKTPPQPDPVSANNGLTALNNTVKLGGTLNGNALINLRNFNLFLNYNTGKIGIGAPTTLNAIVNIENSSTTEDKLILRNLKFITENQNEVDGASGSPKPVYHNLMISESGVLRQLDATRPNGSYDYTLTSTNPSPIGLGVTEEGSDGSGGSKLLWTGASDGGVALPSTGAYVFYFNLYGSLTVPSMYETRDSDASSFYISAFKGSISGQPVDIAEIVVRRVKNYNYASYSITLTVSGNAGDKIYFKISQNPNRNTFSWSLTGGTAPGRTSMIFWRL